jgi:ATP-dependent Clp protease ATP-binding subunit ClpC
MFSLGLIMASNKNKYKYFFMLNKNILFWYYGKAPRILIEIWKNFFLFFWKYFSISEMLATLLSPWRRDIVVKDWAGWKPIESAKILIGNLMSRFVGFFVRIFVILIGLVVLIGYSITGFLYIAYWVLFPLAIVTLFAMFFQAQFWLWVGIILLILQVTAAYLSWRRTMASVIGKDLSEIYGTSVFERICNRMGVGKSQFSPKLLNQEESLGEYLKNINLTKADFDYIVRKEVEIEEEKEKKKSFWRWENLRGTYPLGSQWRYGFTVHLDKYSVDLTREGLREYKNVKLAGHDNELKMLKIIPERPDENCVLIVGPSGIGKKSLINYFAQSLREVENKTLRDLRILLINLGSVVTDAANNNIDAEGMLRKLFYEAAYAGNIILAIENIGHHLESGDSNISSVLEEFLGIPSFRVIATSTTADYHKLVEKQKEVIKYFEIIEMQESSEEETLEIIYSKIEEYEQNQTIFTYKGLEAIIKYSSKYNWDFPLPERAIDLMMNVFMFWEKGERLAWISEQTVAEFISMKTGMPQGEIKGEDREKLMNMEQIMHQEIVGQDEAVRQVSEALRRMRSDIGDAKKPIGSFLFLGPTGVGKTKTAKVLAKVYFGGEDRMIRLDMSEFQNPDSIVRLIGSASGQTGILTSKIKDNPYCLLLLDELEKAYSGALDLFLQIIDEGFVTDGAGEKVNFRNTIIIATSNAGAVLIKEMVGKNAPPEEIKKELVDYIIKNNIFRVEFLNRFESIIFFKPLNQDETAGAVRLLLKEFTQRMQEEKNIEVMYDDTVVNDIIQKGYDPVFGVRSIEKYIKDTVEDYIARKIIAGEVKQGGQIKIAV